MTTYTIGSGDTLYSIAKQFGVPLHLLIEVNGISEPGRIRPSQQLLIPPVTTDASDHSEPEPLTEPVSGSIPVDQVTLRLPASGYIAERRPKDLIVLHFTAGSTAQGAYAAWASAAARVAAAYIVDVDGAIYETFDPSCWAYHLGIKGAASADHRHDKRSVGIEIVNPGPLKADAAGHLCWWPPRNRFERRWCSIDETEKYRRAPFRGFEYFAAFPAAQIRSLSPLIAMLCQRFNIPRRLPAKELAATADAAGYFATFTGIAAHQNFRSDKFDVGPAFPWESISL